MKYRALGVITCLGALAAWGWTAENVAVGVQVIGTEHVTSFPKILLLHVTNPAYTAFDLTQAIASSVLTIDGQPSKRTSTAFQGPAGIPPVSDWDGCLSFNDYSPSITPGKHKVSVKLGNAVTEPVPVRWETPVNWRSGNMKSRLKEIQELGVNMVDGLPKDCVEQWLPVKDGGLQEEDKVRYYLEPQFKVVVPYRQMYEPNGLHAVVDGPPQIYQEQHFTD